MLIATYNNHSVRHTIIVHVLRIQARLLGLTNNSLLHNTQMQGDFGGSTSPPNQGTVMTRKPRQR